MWQKKLQSDLWLIKNWKYLEDFLCFAGERIIGLAEKRVRFGVGGVVEAIVAAARALHGNRVLLVILFHEILHHFRQTHRARLEISGAVFGGMRRLLGGVGDLLRRRWVPEDAGELALEEALQARPHRRLHRLKPSSLLRHGRIDRLNLHCERHDDNDSRTELESLNSQVSPLGLVHLRSTSLILNCESEQGKILVFLSEFNLWNWNSAEAARETLQ